MARRGRPRGALSWARNPVNFAAHHAKVLLELWLAGVPIQIGPEYNLLPSLMTTDRRLVQPKERERTVPWRIKRVLCRLAIARVVELHRQAQAAAPEIERSLRSAKHKAEAELRRRGWTDERIAAHFKRLQVARKRRAHREFEEPGLTAVLKVVNRKAPDNTLRRKAAERRKAAK
jgi:hypothetical protein